MDATINIVLVIAFGIIGLCKFRSLKEHKIIRKDKYIIHLNKFISILFILFGIAAILTTVKYIQLLIRIFN